ncbi:uncharacterized protein LOC108904863 [Anoplophora glabripennis]|uniref:uncharacterized protein LOC108904863 n=1 Tax=Anoplophora glabripennis TaxID=217634 RepID=UPI000874C242|nr:uncharacterized protein LOC108904863 [Anoplophora glabripennis]
MAVSFSLTTVNKRKLYETHDKCNYTLVSPKRIINPYRTILMNIVPQKPFGSFYLKCAACLAVANQISRIVENITEQPKTRQICQDSINKDVSNKVNGLCSQGFKNYDLRRCKEFSLVTDKFKCTEHVRSTMDGGWTKKLRELCSLYTAHMDLEHISNIYTNNTQELSSHLCK